MNKSNFHEVAPTFHYIHSYCSQTTLQSIARLIAHLSVVIFLQPFSFPRGFCCWWIDN